MFIKKLLWLFCYLNPFSTPNTLHRYESRDVADGIIQEVSGRSYDCVVYIWQKYAEVFPSLVKNIITKRAVIDLIDSPYLIHRRMRPHGVLQRVMYLVEGCKIKWWERRLAKSLDALVFIAEEDANAALIGKNAEKAIIVSNGIYLDDCSVAIKEAEEMYDIGYVGNMSYQPNIDAALYLYEKIYLPLYELDSTITLKIVGREPVQAIKDLNVHPGVTVTGEVCSIPEHLKAMKIAVFPMVSGGGLQNKVLDAMYAGIPVVTSSIGNEGIDAINGVHILIADTPEAYLENIQNILKDETQRKELSLRGREFVASKFSWDKIIKRYLSQVIREDDGE
jgi:glycosyltransferase involved in cell wall biosynthesis